VGVYQIPKAPVAKRTVQVPQWSLEETRGRFKCDRAVTDLVELGLLVIKGRDGKVWVLFELLEDDDDDDDDDEGS
jgi:hypothetical protein